MKIIVDGFGGDNAPIEVLKGCELGVRLYDVDIVITGDEDKLRKTADDNNISLDRIEIYHAPDVIEVEDNPVKILKDKKNCSMAAAFNLLNASAGDAFLSAGSTGAIVVGASSLVKRIKGVKRAALAPILPSEHGCFMLLDAGANIDCKPEMLAQFGVMGSVYMDKVMKIEKPRVGLANIGAEECKGDALRLEAYKMLENAPLNFIGNTEARDIPMDAAEVIVADGFTGNVILKLMEGFGSVVGRSLKEIFYKNTVSKLSALLVKNGIKDFKKKMDYTEYGGAPLMGISKPVIKAHGSSNAKAFASAIRQAKFFVESRAIDELTQQLALLEDRSGDKK